ncbi:NuoI/complex I 23 kDa subunit family protein [Pseudopedobacter beijingensis]|uniref:NuoI/complex I 23 kDa subunit family protein n=1 Tax=Pseudopedobacter beijingensis TaxID=1207056 RepID=A0ABW4IFL0_9SPHI
MIVKKAYNGLKTSWKGLLITLKHFFGARKSKKLPGIQDPDYFAEDTGVVTLQYPHQKLPIPEVGRYQLHVEIDDCIVCDLCAKICPVNCIEIESIKATDVIGKTSDGSVKRLYAPKFDIDMAKCMYCGLCTTVCPTECITMTNQYDKTVWQVADLNYEFATMTEEEAEQKRLELEKQQEERRLAKLAAATKKEEDK